MSLFGKIASGLLKGVSAVTGIVSKVIPIPVVSGAAGLVSKLTGGVAQKIDTKNAAKAAQTAVFPSASAPSASVDGSALAAQGASFASTSGSSSEKPKWYQMPVIWVVAGLMIIAGLYFVVFKRKRR